EYGVVNDFSVTEQFDFPEAVYAQQVIPNHIDTKEAAMLVTLREVYSAVNYFQIETDASVVIIGSGPVAQTFTKVMQLMGIQSIIAVVRNDKKEELMYGRSEEHTSELQSRFDLVCRLLLEKKNHTNTQ